MGLFVTSFFLTRIAFTGGLDHVEAFETNDVNVLVVDTEMYSNTGGQQSKATPAGATAKFAMAGKTQKKKNLGEIFMTYEHVYVASVALHNQAQVLQAFLEADQYNGPSIIIAYAPCIQQGVRPNGLNDMVEESRLAVDSGYWPIYRYNPALAKAGQNPFILDSKKLRKDVASFLQHESRFLNLRKKNPEIAEKLWSQINDTVQHRMDHLRQLASSYKDFEHSSEAPLLTLFASETGTAARIANDFAAACTLSSTASSMEDVDVNDIEGKTVVFFISTCGQGAMPRNGRSFLQALQSRTTKFSAETKFLVFGLGDSSYYFFVKAAKLVEDRLLELGASRMLEMGTGDDSAEQGMEQGLHDWLQSVWKTLQVAPPSEVPHITPVQLLFSKQALLHPDEDSAAIRGYFRSQKGNVVQATILKNDTMCRPSYNRDFRTIRIAKSKFLQYELGDALEIFPQNDPEKVSRFLHDYTNEFGEHTVVKIHAFGIDGEVSLGALFTNVLDLFGKPSKHFLHQLATFESDAAEKNIMLEPSFLRIQAKETGMTVADVLLRFRKAQPPLPALLAMIPTIKPRAYSIASAPLVATDYIDLLVLIETWWCDQGMRYGLNCDMLRKLTRGDSIWCRVQRGSMEAPTPDQPVLCAGIGSGLAPHMAYLRDRVRADQNGEEVAPFSLFFGNRYEAEEFLYEEELKEYDQKYSWFSLHTAFSRDDPAKKVYVQDLVGQTDDAYRLLLKSPNGQLYICGNRNLPKPMQEAIIKSFSRGENEKVEAARISVEHLYTSGRAQQEVW